MPVRSVVFISLALYNALLKHHMSRLAKFVLTKSVFLTMNHINRYNPLLLKFIASGKKQCRLDVRKY